MRRSVLALVTVLLFGLAPAASASYVTNGKLTLTYLGGRFGPITDIVSPPGQPNDLWIVDQNGLIIQRGPHGKRRTVLNLEGSIAYTSSPTDERGLLAVAFPANYRQSKLYYVYYTAPRPDDPDGSILTVAGVENGMVTPVVIFPHANLDNHNGGDLHVGPGNDLYLSTGDGSGIDDSATTSQNPASPLGKIIRINPATGAYTFLDLGLRNPFRFSFDPPTHSWYVADVGESRWESVYHEPDSATGLNFGWPMCEGGHIFNPANLTAATGPCTTPGVTLPTFEYSHTYGCAVIGGYVEHDRRFAHSREDLRGRYLFGDFCTGQLWSMSPGGKARMEKKLGINELTTFGEDSRGRIYMGGLTGKVFRIDPVAAKRSSATRSSSS